MKSKSKNMNNKLLLKLVEDDQSERLHFFDNPEKVTANDKIRRQKTAKLLKARKVKTALDYLNAALIYQHGVEIKDYEKARSLAQKSIDLGGGGWAKWLYAITTDRLLLWQGKKQKFCTQFDVISKKNPKSGKTRNILKTLPYDKRISDKTRIKYHVGPLKDYLDKDGEPQSSPKSRRKIMFDMD